MEHDHWYVVDDEGYVSDEGVHTTQAAWFSDGTTRKNTVIKQRQSMSKRLYQALNL